MLIDFPWPLFKSFWGDDVVREIDMFSGKIAVLKLTFPPSEKESTLKGKVSQGEQINLIF